MTVAGTPVPIPPTFPMSDVSHNSSVDLRRNRSQGGAPGLRYGSAELGSVPRGRSTRLRSRERDRTGQVDRSISSLRQPDPHAPAGSRSRRMGPQETADWDAIIDNLLDRVETAENNVRRQGQAVGKIEENLQDCTSDIAEYKKFVHNSFANLAGKVESSVGGLGTTHYQ